MYSTLPIRSLGIEESGDFFKLQGCLSVDGTNLPGDSCVVLSTDPKPRLRWTTELHERFVDAVTQLGGPDMNSEFQLSLVELHLFSAMVLLVNQYMREVSNAKNNYENNGGERSDPIPFEVTSPASYISLQKYRMGKQSAKEGPENSKDVSCPAESQDTGSSTSGSSRVIAQDINEGLQVTEALRVQMEVQRRLHEQLEVQRRLQFRIEAQGKYLQSILEKACKAFNSQSLESNGLEMNGEDLPALATKVANDCEGIITVPSLPEIGSSIENRNACHLPARLGDCMLDDCLPSNGIGALKKRPRAFTNANGLPMESNTREVEWMMTRAFGGWFSLVCINAIVPPHRSLHLGGVASIGLRLSRTTYVECGVCILARLPVKSLLRFQSVSTSWNDIISDREFKKAQSDQSKAMGHVNFLLQQHRGDGFKFIKCLSALKGCLCLYGNKFNGYIWSDESELDMWIMEQDGWKLLTRIPKDGTVLYYTVKPTSSMKTLFKSYAKKKQIMDYKTIRFLYNGERLSSRKTVNQVGLENGDEIDAMMDQEGGGYAH
ncbi:myb family transcription factor family protein [Capsicum annuum]|nr:myb family transcription factor family protein [Capsicum annuum]